MFKSPWIRKPDFKNISSIDYDEYWSYRGWQIASGLKPREKIMYELVGSGSRVLDVGCGNSRLPLELKNKGVQVAVADLSELVLREYKKLDISGNAVDLEKITPGSVVGDYDYIIMSEVLEHIKNPEDVIRILKSRTKRFLLTVPNSAAYVFRYGLMFRGRFFTQWVHHPSEHVRYWSHIDFLDWLLAQGLFVEESIPSDGFTFRGLLPWFPSLWKNFLGYRMVYVCRVLDGE